jgi:Co/Zn/Cd efflux system component
MGAGHGHGHEPVKPSTGPMLVVGAVGLLVNLVAMAAFVAVRAVVLGREVLAGARALLLERHGIDHAPVQVETEAAACKELSW